ncbi:HNH endonuclease family protein, partial [Pseudomonas aeruginosa]|nr:HNH endonuclease family protein [Pseudomonas aeruginosa]
NQRIERYALVIEDILKGVYVDRVELTPGECAEMLRALDGNVYEMTARRRNYLILRLDSFVSAMAANYTPNVLTIEHILPQTVDPASEWATTWPDAVMRMKWLHRLANLVPLTRARNSKALNYDFAKKKS